MIRRFRAVTLLVAVLTGCVETSGGGEGRVVSAPAQAAAPASTGLQIAEMALASRNFTAAEVFGISFRVRTPGAGKVVAYWLATRLGEKRYAIASPLPVIANGMVELTAAGPLPDHREAGRFAVEFWVEDQAGAQSNRLTTEINVQ